MSSKQLIRGILALEKELALSEDERRLLGDDLEFLITEVPSRQEQWSVDTTTFTFPSDANAEGVDQEDAEAAAVVNTKQEKWLQEFLFPQRDLDSYHFAVMEGVIRVLVHLQLAAPSSHEAPAWLIAFLRGETTPSLTEYGDASDAAAPDKSTTTVSLFFKTNYELLRKIEQLKQEQREVHDRMERLQAAKAHLESELSMRNRFIATLSESHVTTRTHAIMDGTPVFLDSQKHWVLPGFLLMPSNLSDEELLGLKRAESFLMQKDETCWRFLLMTQKRYDASVSIQSCWRCSRDSRAYRELTRRRRQAVVVIQRNYFSYLFHRAVRLPAWCVLGREVLVAPSVALKCAISFQFYPKKDFPTGNYRRLPVANSSNANGEVGLTIAEMMEICRQEEECAGFSTDGAMKRFLPRKLSQLKDMADSGDGHGNPSQLTMRDGLYVKIYPLKSENPVNTGIIVAIPDDRFGLVHVCLDGTAVVEKVPLAKLSDRWKRIRIRLSKKREKKKPKRTFVFGKVREEEDEEDDTVVGLEAIGSPGNNQSLHDNNAAAPAFEKLDDDFDQEAEQEELRRRRRKRVAAQVQAQDTSQAVADGSNVLLNQENDREDDDDELIEFLFEDQATKRMVRREPKRTFADPETRAKVISERKRAYEDEQERKYERKKLASVVRLQCAWRSKRARDAFRQVIQLRAKEKEREHLVQQVHVTHAESASGKGGRRKQKQAGGKTNFFTKLFRS